MLDVKIWFASLILLAAACEEGTDASDDTAGDSTGQADGTGGSTGEDSGNMFPTVQATVDVAAACADPGAASVTLQARLVGCVGGGPCTIPDPPRIVSGTMVACPSEDDATVMQVELERSGMFAVEILVTFDDGSEARECFAPAQGQEVAIGAAELDQRPTIEVTGTGMPCAG
jgi:hypothetical protein